VAALIISLIITFTITFGLIFSAEITGQSFLTFDSDIVPDVYEIALIPPPYYTYDNNR
jgi:hypothetical protein